MLLILTAPVQTGKTRWLEALVSELASRGVASYGVVAPGRWHGGPDGGELVKDGIDNVLLPSGERVRLAEAACGHDDEDDDEDEDDEPESIDYNDTLFDKCQRAARLLRNRKDMIRDEETEKNERVANLVRAVKLLELKPQMEQKEMAELLGISPQAKITTGCLDQAAGAIGVGNIRPGIFSENIGAALAICVPTSKLTYDPNRQMPVHYFATPDTYMMHTFTTGGMCLRWFRDGFCQPELDIQNLTGVDAYDLMGKEADRVAPGSDGLIMLPHLQGSMAPDVNLNAKGVFYGATLQHNKAHFVRSIMESLGYLICRNLEAIDAMGLEVKQIRTMGGGSKSDVWNQIKADITGKTLHVTYSSQDTACLGAAILAGKAAGVFESIESAVDSMVKIKKTFEPNPANRAVYDKQYKKFKLLFNSLSTLFDEDAKG